MKTIISNLDKIVIKSLSKTNIISENKIISSWHFFLFLKILILNVNVSNMKLSLWINQFELEIWIKSYSKIVKKCNKNKTYRPRLNLFNKPVWIYVYLHIHTHT